MEGAARGKLFRVTMATRYLASIADRLVKWCRRRSPTREAIVVAATLAILFEMVYLAAFFVRSELLLKASDATVIIRTVFFVVGLKTVLFYIRGLCHRPLRSIHFEDISQLVRATTTSLLLLVATNHYCDVFFPGWIPIPRAVLVLDWAFTILAVGGVQAAARSIFEELMPAMPVGNQRSALVIGASDAGRRIAAALSSTGPHGYFIAGFLDDNPALYGGPSGSLRVLSRIDHAIDCARRLRISEMIVTPGALFGRRFRALCEECRTQRIKIGIAEPTPSPHGSASNSAPTVRVRPVEIGDLLTHPTGRIVEAEESAVARWLDGQTVLVTGAGGSIGSEICRQLVRYRPGKVVILDRSESALFEIHQELLENSPLSCKVELVLADITNVDRMERVFIEHQPGIVIHAAAYKHVPMLQMHPVEAIENNILATASLAELAETQGVGSFVALSTDKVVHPRGVMGASKLIAERFLQAFAATSNTCFTIVRFGNVLHSSGSVVNTFARQLSRRSPVTLTDPAATRYFMTCSEAARLVLVAGASTGTAETCVLEMGEPLPIQELLESLAFVMHVPWHEVTIRHGRLRSGEKLEEQLFFEDEVREASDGSAVIRVRRPARPLALVRQWLGDLKNAIAAGDAASAHDTLMAIVADDCARVLPEAAGVRDGHPEAAPGATAS